MVLIAVFSLMDKPGAEKVIALWDMKRIKVVPFSNFSGFNVISGYEV